MTQAISISIYQVVGHHLCVAPADGQKVFERINQALVARRSVSLSFENVTALTGAFLNAAIGHLYGNFDEDTLRSHINITHIENHDLGLLVGVIKNAKVYFKDKKSSNPTTHEE